MAEFSPAVNQSGAGVWKSPGLAAERIDYVVCIPTFRRPEQLRDTLASLHAQTGGRSFAVVVVDNDAQACAGAPIAREMLSSAPLCGIVLIEPTRGNCAAINAAFAAARQEFPNARGFLMIDDDEVAMPGWLDAMVQAAEEHGADIVGGPVLPQFEDRHSRFVRHPAFQSAYRRSGFVPLIYGSGNCLITRQAFERLDEPGFDMQFNFLGGGDTDFFTRCQRAGMRFYWAQEAAIDETVPASRTTFGWLVRRALRTGSLNYRIDRKRMHSRADRLRLALKNLGALPLGVVRGVRLLIEYRDPAYALHPLFIAAGRSLAAIGIEPHQYGR